MVAYIYIRIRTSHRAVATQAQNHFISATLNTIFTSSSVLNSLREEGGVNSTHTPAAAIPQLCLNIVPMVKLKKVYTDGIKWLLVNRLSLAVSALSFCRSRASDARK